MCLVWISEKRAIISLYSVNWLVFITDTKCVYCAVRAGTLNILKVFKVLITHRTNVKGRSLDHAWHLGLLTTLFQLHWLHCAESDLKTTVNGTYGDWVSVEGGVQRSPSRDRKTGTLDGIRTCISPMLCQNQAVLINYVPSSGLKNAGLRMITQLHHTSE
jgi:hypothetical protein